MVPGLHCDNALLFCQRGRDVFDKVDPLILKDENSMGVGPRYWLRMGYGKLAVFAMVITGASRKMHVQGVPELEESNSQHLSRHCLPGLSLRDSKYLLIKGFRA